MAKTISGNIANGYVLANATLNPITNLGTIALGASSNAAALEGETIAAWTVTNQGTIDGAAGSGVDLLAGGDVTNSAGAWIGGIYGVAIQGVAGTVVNAGTIDASTIDASAGASGVFLTHGGSVTNQTGGHILGGYGVSIKGDVGTVLNAGTIVAATTNAAIELSDGGSVVNAASASLSGKWGVAIQGAALGVVVNDGVIRGGAQSGVFLTGGTVTNQAAGQVSGNWAVAVVGGAGTVINGGSMDGTGGTAVTLAAGYANRMVVEPDASCTGMVDGGNTLGATIVSTLELAAGAATGTLTGLGAKYLDFGAVVFDPGAFWSLSGNTAGLPGTISGFAAGDTIEVTGVIATGSSFSNGILTLDEASGSATLDLPGTFSMARQFVVRTAPGDGGTDVSLACFCAGTRILTATGEVPVEDLRIGDQMVTLRGRRLARIVWLGHRHMDCLGHPRADDVWPIRIATGAIADGVPHRDLWLSPEHAVLLRMGAEAVLVPIRHLLNGTTIAQVPCSSVIYWHVELALHDAIVAEGLPAETYLDTGNRADFANGGPALNIDPIFVDAIWHTRACAAQLRHGEALARLQHRLALRAAWLARTDPEWISNSSF